MEKIAKVCEKLNRHGFKCTVAATAEEAARIALQLIGGGSVGIGGSVTIDRLGLYDKLKERGNRVFWHWKDGGEMRFKALCADTYLCSANAVTEEGSLILVDGCGNRVAALSFGPKNAVVIAGKNKIVKDREAGFSRVKSGICSGRNGKRLGLPTPCALTGACADCNSPQRMCSVTAVFDRPTGHENFYVILVAEDLGY